jgi:TolA-binding protein
MTRLHRFCLIACAGCSLVLPPSAVAGADCVGASAATPSSECVVQADGQHVVLSTALADQLTKLAEVVPAMREQIARYQQLESALKVEVDETRAAAAARKTQAEEALRLANAAIDAAAGIAAELDSERASSGSVWRSPWLWLTVGAVLGGGGVTALALSVR